MPEAVTNSTSNPDGLVHLYNSSQISGAKAMLWQVSGKDYCVEKLVFHTVFFLAICYPLGGVFAQPNHAMEPVIYFSENSPQGQI